MINRYLASPVEVLRSLTPLSCPFVDNIALDSVCFNDRNPFYPGATASLGADLDIGVGFGSLAHIKHIRLRLERDDGSLYALQQRCLVAFANVSDFSAAESYSLDAPSNSPASTVHS